MQLFQSKKFQMSVIGILVVFLTELVPMLSETQIEALVAPIVAYILGQGIADMGKERAKVEQEMRSSNS